MHGQCKCQFQWITCSALYWKQISKNKDITAKSTQRKTIDYGTYNSNNEYHCQFPAYKSPPLREWSLRMACFSQFWVFYTCQRTFIWRSLPSSRSSLKPNVCGSTSPAHAHEYYITHQNWRHVIVAASQITQKQRQFAQLLVMATSRKT